MTFSTLLSKLERSESGSRELCLKARCYSPVACGGWGYCRERNLPTDPMDEHGQRPKELIEARRALSKETHHDHK